MNIAHQSVSQLAETVPVAPVLPSSQPASGFGETLAASLRDRSKNQEQAPVTDAPGSAAPGVAPQKTNRGAVSQLDTKQRRGSPDAAEEAALPPDGSAPPTAAQTLLLASTGALPTELAVAVLPDRDADRGPATAVQAADASSQSQPGPRAPAAAAGLAAQAGTAAALAAGAFPGSTASGLADAPSGGTGKLSEAQGGAASQLGVDPHKVLRSPAATLPEPENSSVQANRAVAASEKQQGETAPAAVELVGLGKRPSGVESAGAADGNSRGATLDDRARHASQAATPAEAGPGTAGTSAGAGGSSQSGGQLSQNAASADGGAVSGSPGQSQPVSSIQIHIAASSSGDAASAPASLVASPAGGAANQVATTLVPESAAGATLLPESANGAAGSPSLRAANAAPGAIALESVPAINTAQVLGRVSNTEIRVGLRSEEFGAISIATSLSPGSVVAQIALDHSVLGGALGRALAAHLPGVEERLGSALGVTARVEVRDAASQLAQGGSGNAPGSSTHGQAGSGGGRGQGRSEAAAQDWNPAGPDAGAGPNAMAGAVGAGIAGRLSVRA